MLVRVNLLRPHRNEEKEPEEVEQEHLGDNRSYYFQTNFQYRKLLVVPHDDANHENDGDEEVANRCEDAKDQIIFWPLVIDWQATNVRVHTPSSY